MIAVITTGESLADQIRVEEVLTAAGLAPDSVEPGGAPELDELWFLQHNAEKLAEADPETVLKDWEGLADDLLRLDDPLPAKMEDRLREMIATSKQTRKDMP